MDSKFQFRDGSPPPTAWAPSFRWVSGGSLSRRNSSFGLPKPTTARVIPPRRPSIGPNPTEASKPLPIWRGTEISITQHVMAIARVGADAVSVAIEEVTAL
jgi:hypothetical protein